MAVFLLLCWAALSVLGYLGKDSIYKNYKIDVMTTPYFVLVFDGIHDGVYPWNRELWQQENPQQEDGTVGTEASVPETEISMPETGEAPVVREFVQVDDSYFDDAVFIGDSRTVGLRDYGGLDQATFYATVGLNIYDMWTEKFCEVEGEMVTLEEALQSRQFKKVYFQIGINEMGRGTLDGFMQEYEQAVRKFKELQPEAIIYVQGIMRVTKEKSDSDKIFNNQGIQMRNERIAGLADNQTVFYIDMNEVVCTPYGDLREDLTFDDLHLYASKYDIWVDFLKTKGVAL